MKRVLASLAIFLVLFATILPSPASAGGSWHHGGHGGFHHGGHGCCHHGGGWWWWPGAFIGGLALGAAAVATAPFWAFAPPPVYAPPVVYSQPVYAQPAYSQPVYAQPSQTVYAQPAYAQPVSYPVPPPGSAPLPNVPPAGSAPPENYQAPSASVAQRAAPPAVRGEVVYDNGRYLLFGDGVRHPWQWVWVPAGAPSPPPPPR
jgi:hypothetical protein